MENLGNSELDPCDIDLSGDYKKAFHKVFGECFNKMSVYVVECAETGREWKISNSYIRGYFDPVTGLPTPLFFQQLKKLTKHPQLEINFEVGRKGV